MVSCTPTSLMAAWAPTKPSPPPLASMASSSSAFLSNGRKSLSRRSFPVSSRPARGGRAAGTPPIGLRVRCLFGLGVPELVVIAGVAALVFGPKQLPEIGRSIGKTVKSFQQAAKEFETELKKEPEDADKPSPAESAANMVSNEEPKKELEASSTKEGT